MKFDFSSISSIPTSASLTLHTNTGDSGQFINVALYDSNWNSTTSYSIATSTVTQFNPSIATMTTTNGAYPRNLTFDLDIASLWNVGRNGDSLSFWIGTSDGDDNLFNVTYQTPNMPVLTLQFGNVVSISANLIDWTSIDAATPTVAKCSNLSSCQSIPFGARLSRFAHFECFIHFQQFCDFFSFFFLFFFLV